MTDPEKPAFDELADADDELGWDREQQGRMIDAAAPPPKTEPYEPKEESP